jgi:branched-chain amino acid transport system ATP-binding protein
LPLLSVRNVTRRFGGIVALSNVTFDVDAGEIVGLIGPNGAGKTTAFNLISGLYRPDGGAIEFAGESLLRTPPHGIVRRGIARTFQNVELFPTMTVRENVRVGTHGRYGWRRGGDAEQRVAEVLRFVGLVGDAARTVAGLPYGTQKRVELARALASEPRLLLLDEPAGGLDHDEVSGLVRFLGSLRAERGVTVLLVEHHMQLVMSVSDRVYVLDFGRSIAAGTPDKVRRDPAVVEAYLGAPAD